MSTHPYEDRFGIIDAMPEDGAATRRDHRRARSGWASEEDQTWQTGKCSGTMYCGDMEHYAFLNQAFAPFAHVNALQRDMCPSATKFESEIIAMTLDMLHGVGRRRAPSRRRAVRLDHVGRHRQHRHRDARLPRLGPGREGHHRTRT